MLLRGLLPFSHCLQHVLVLAGAAVVCSGTLSGCQNAPAQMPPPKPPEVVVGRAVLQEVLDQEEFTGRTEALEAVEVKARVSGQLVKIAFEEGDDVKKGDPLFEIDPRPLQAELDRAEGNLVQAEAHVKRLESDYGRMRTLLPGVSTTREEHDKVFGDLAEARGAVRAAVAARDMARLNLEYSRITSPIDGRIGRRMLDPGNMVKADETSLIYIGKLDPMYATFDVDERTYLRLFRTLAGASLSAGGQGGGTVTLAQVREIPVAMGLVDEEGFPHKGKINFVDNRIDQNTGSVWVRGIFANPNKLLTPGLFVRVQIPVGEPRQAILIPEQSLGSDQGRKFVYVVNDQNEVAYRPVEVGTQHGQLRVVKKGIEAGERVVVSGLQKIRDKAKVSVKDQGSGVRGEGSEKTNSGP
jgi:RND family efflux transporter MFP subunit